ncbi:MAG: hypothetical protein H6P99_736 [Holophagaceae bacterium]|nr:hypothetical protein [Holophagaceae bacterium]
MKNKETVIDTTRISIWVRCEFIDLVITQGGDIRNSQVPNMSPIFLNEFNEPIIIEPFQFNSIGEPPGYRPETNSLV